MMLLRTIPRSLPTSISGNPTVGAHATTDGIFLRRHFVIGIVFGNFWENSVNVNNFKTLFGVVVKIIYFCENR